MTENICFKCKNRIRKAVIGKYIMSFKKVHHFICEKCKDKVSKELSIKLKLPINAK